MIRNNHAREGGRDGDKEAKRDELGGGELSRTGFTVWMVLYLTKKKKTTWKA